MIGRRTPPHRRRGAALLLVLVALAIGLLLVATWLDGRRESVPVARRVAAGAMARQAALGAVDLAIATIDAEPDWRTAIAEGRFDEPVEFAGATCRYEIVDADDGNAPDATTMRLRVCCSAVADGVEACLLRLVEVDVPAEDVRLDVTFGETAILVENNLRIRDDAAVIPWLANPLANGGPLVVGSLDGRAEAVSIEPDAMMADAEVLEVGARSCPDQPGGRRFIVDPLPRLRPPEIPEPRNPSSAEPDIRIEEAPGTDIECVFARVPAGTSLVFEEDRVIRGERDIVVEDGVDITVAGGTLVFDAGRVLSIRDARIVVADGARLVLRGGRRLMVFGAELGPESIINEFGGGDIPPPDANAGAILLTADRPTAIITLSGRSTVVGSILAPDTTVRLRNTSALHGRVYARRVELLDESVVHARPDDGRVVGLTSPVGPHRDDVGRLLEEVARVDPSDPESLATVADRTGITVVADDVTASPDPVVRETRGPEIRERLRRLLDDRRRRRGGPRWWWAGEAGEDA